MNAALRTDHSTQPYVIGSGARQGLLFFLHEARNLHTLFTYNAGKKDGGIRFVLMDQENFRSMNEGTQVAFLRLPGGKREVVQGVDALHSYLGSRLKSYKGSRVMEICSFL